MDTKTIELHEKQEIVPVQNFTSRYPTEDFLYTIRNLRSVRKYQDKELPKEALDDILEAGRLAPSSFNFQPWHFFVVNKGETRQKIQQTEAIYGKFAYSAPSIIVVRTEVRNAPAYMAMELKEYLPETYKRLSMDASGAVTYMRLCAATHGISSCMIGLVNEHSMQKIFGKENEDVKYFYPLVLTLGYAAENPKSRRKKLEKISTFL